MSATPYLLFLEAMVNCVTTNFDKARWAYNVSSSVDGELDPPAKLQPCKCQAKGVHEKKSTNCNISCTCEFLPLTATYLRVPLQWNVNIFLAELLIVFFSHCYCHGIIDHHCWYCSAVHPRCTVYLPAVTLVVKGTWEANLQNLF